MPQYTITNVPPVEASTLADWATFITAVGGVIGLVVWPIVVGYVLRLYREPISGVIGKLTKIEGPGGFTAQTSDHLSDAREAVEQFTAASAAVKDAPPEQTVDGGEKPVEGPENEDPTPPPDSDDEGAEEKAWEEVGSFESRNRLETETAIFDATFDPDRAVVNGWLQTRRGRVFDDLVRVHPASAVVYVWNEVEERLLSFANRMGMSLDGQRTAGRSLINRLSRKRLISAELEDLLEEMISLRNRAAHVADSNISAIDAIEFERSARAAIREMNRIVADGITPDQGHLF